MDMPLLSAEADTIIKVVDFRHLTFMDAFNEIYKQMSDFYASFGLEMNSSLIELFIDKYYPDLKDVNRPLYLQLINPEKHEIYIEV